MEISTKHFLTGTWLTLLAGVVACAGTAAGENSEVPFRGALEAAAVIQTPMAA